MTRMRHNPFKTPNAIRKLKPTRCMKSPKNPFRNGKFTGQYSWQDTEKLAKSAIGQDPYGLRSEFVELIGIAQRLNTKEPQ